VGGFTIIVVSMNGASAMAGAVGAGGLGDPAIRHGYQRFDATVIVVVIVVLWPGQPGAAHRRPLGAAAETTALKFQAGSHADNKVRYKFTHSVTNAVHTGVRQTKRSDRPWPQSLDLHVATVLHAPNQLRS
jgi:hypothetical protein